MNAAVVFTEDFLKDLRAQTRRLLEEDKADWAERLIDEVEEAAALLGRFPEAGPVEARLGGHEIRRVLLRKLPFVAWYRWRAQEKKVVVLRLFHLKQRR